MKAFFITPVALAAMSLRRFEDGACSAMPGSYSYHNVSVPLGQVDEPLRPPEDRYERVSPSAEDFAGDPRWPIACACGRVFTDAASRQANRTRLYAGAPDGQLYTLGEAPIGAMWDAWWMSSYRKGEDGICLIVKTPGGDWCVDDRASNCTKPDDDVHRCWVRHGDPRCGVVHVDKSGDTCAAGAGSILIGGYHGFLHNGELTSC